MVLLAIISGISWAVPLGAGVSLFNRLEREAKILVAYFIFIGLVEAFSFYQALNKVSTIWLFHVFTPLEYGFLVVVFSYWQKRPLLRLVLQLSIPLFALICIANKLFVENLVSFDNFSTSLESLVLIIISVRTLFDLSRENSSTLSKDSRFWIAIAVLTYFSGNLPTFAFANVIAVSSIKHILNVISNILFARGFLCYRLKYRLYGV